jgi:hypothetical protein
LKPSRSIGVPPITPRASGKKVQPSCPAFGLRGIEATGVGKTAGREYIRRAEVIGITWPVPGDVGDQAARQASTSAISCRSGAISTKTSAGSGPACCGRILAITSRPPMSCVSSAGRIPHEPRSLPPFNISGMTVQSPTTTRHEPAATGASPVFIAVPAWANGKTQRWVISRQATRSALHPVISKSGSSLASTQAKPPTGHLLRVPDGMTCM